MFKIDNTEYDGVMSLKRKFTIDEDGNGGKALDGTVLRSIIGTRYDYTLVIDSDGMTKTEYDTLYALISGPGVSHTFAMPDTKTESTFLTFTGYVTGGTDELQRIDSDGRVWGNLSVSVYTLAPQRVPT